MEIPNLLAALQQKGLVLRAHYVKAGWTLEARNEGTHEVQQVVSASKFEEAARELLHRLHLLD